LHEEDINELYLLLNNINKIFDISIDDDKAIKEIKNIILVYRLSKKYYEKILNKIKPKIIIEVCSYGFSRFLFNELAKKRGIKIVELQHGTMGKYDISYNFYKKLELDTFPEYIYLFGEYWKNNTKFPLGKENLVVTGFPYFESRLKELKKNCRKNSKKENILFISQGTVGKKLSQLAVQLNKIIDHKKYNIIFKLHPGEYDRWESEYPWLKKSNIEIVSNNKKDIYYYFSKCNFQVGVSSTAIFEGLGFDLKTFIYKVHGYKYMKYLYENNYAQFRFQ